MPPELATRGADAPSSSNTLLALWRQAEAGQCLVVSREVLLDGGRSLYCQSPSQREALMGGMIASWILSSMVFGQESAVDLMNSAFEPNSPTTAA